MVNTREYWVDKDNRAKVAREHTKEMSSKYKDEIDKSIQGTKIYDVGFCCDKTDIKDSMNIVIEDIDSVSAVLKYGDDNTAILNFSSYKNPGGMFLNGSKAQEECLCHESYLYNVLSQFTQSFYDWNNQNKNKALYKNRGLYSPHVVFERGINSKTVAVITCAAPNKSAAQKYLQISDEENSVVLQSRIRYVLDIARDNGVKTLILGAYGCGVFGQDATEVATVFKNLLGTTHKCFDTVVFAIPYGRDGNYHKFLSTFK